MAVRDRWIPWTEQPQFGEVHKAEDLPLGSWVFNGAQARLIDDPYTVEGTVTVEPGLGGLAAVAGSSSSCVRTGSRDIPAAPGECTFVAQFIRTDATFGYFWSVGGTTSGDPIERFAVNTDAGGSAAAGAIGVRYRANSTQDRTSRIANDTVPVGELTTVVCKINPSGDTASFWINGRSVATFSNTGGSAYTTPSSLIRTTPILANDLGSGVTGATSTLKLFLAARLLFSHPDPERLSAEPWSMLTEPQRIWVPVAAASSGVPTLSASTYVPGSLTSTGWRPRVTAS